MAERCVVVDTADGYVFRTDHTGVPFNRATAARFADHRNSELKPEFQTYQVFKLVPVDNLKDTAHGREAGKWLSQV